MKCAWSMREGAIGQAPRATAVARGSRVYLFGWPASSSKASGMREKASVPELEVAADMKSAM
jgi:hypothetical protein